jgi:hypothetical protein
VIHGLALGALAAHINIGIYNAGLSSASATIEIHRACDGSTTNTRVVTIPPNTVQQFTGFAIPDTSDPCGASFSGNPSGIKGLAYAVVTVDQPSLTFGSILGFADVQTSNIKDVPVSTTQVMPGLPQL